MKQLIVCNIISLDGYYTGPANSVMVLPMDGAFDRISPTRIPALQTISERKALPRSQETSDSEALILNISCRLHARTNGF